MGHHASLWGRASPPARERGPTERFSSFFAQCNCFRREALAFFLPGSLPLPGSTSASAHAAVALAGRAARALAVHVTVGVAPHQLAAAAAASVAARSGVRARGVAAVRATFLVNPNGKPSDF